MLVTTSVSIQCSPESTARVCVIIDRIYRHFCDGEALNGRQKHQYEMLMISQFDNVNLPLPVTSASQAAAIDKFTLKNSSPSFPMRRNVRRKKDAAADITSGLTLLLRGVKRSQLSRNDVEVAQRGVSEARQSGLRESQAITH